jgi:hypothetical protein
MLPRFPPRRLVLVMTGRQSKLQHQPLRAKAWSSTRSRALWLALLLCAIAPSAQAETPPTKVIVLHVDGAKLAVLDRQELDTALEDKVKLYPTLALVPGPTGEITDEMIDLECIDLDAECMSKLGKKFGGDRVVHADVSHRTKGVTLNLRVIDVQKGVAIHTKTLEAKTASALVPLLTAELEVPFGPPPKIIRKGTLVVEASSKKAQILLGVDLVGTGRVSLELEPGEYTIRVTEPGHEDVIRKVMVDSEKTTTEAVAMVAIVKPPVEPPAEPKVGKSSSGWILWAVVGAVVVGGTVAVIALSSGSGDDVVRGPAVLGIDGSSAWRDPATFGGRP